MIQIMVASMRAVAKEMRSGQVNILKLRPKGFPGGFNAECERYLKVLT